MRKRTVVFVVCGAILILLLASVLTGLVMVFDRKAEVPPRQADMASVFSGVQKINRQLRRIANDPPGRVRELALTEAEANALADSFLTNPFAVSLIGGVRSVPAELKRTRFELRDGILHVFYAHDTGTGTPFGRYVNLKIRMRASVENGAPVFEILSCRAGSFPVPAGIAANVLNDILRKNYSGKPADRIVRDGVVSLNAKDGKLILKYHPKELIDTADTVFYGSSDNRIRRFLTSYGRK